MIDLHTHSSISDGSDSPERLVELAAEAGCELIALTDHDATDGVAAARARGEQLGVEVMAGVEFSCHTSRRSVHLLGYFKNYDTPLLQTELRALRELRHQRNARLLKYLNDQGLAITMDDVNRFGQGSSIGRPHFAAALMEKDYVSSISEAFRRYLSDITEHKIARGGLYAGEAIAWIREAGGVAVWAHPMTPSKYAMGELEPDLEEMKAAGLGGIESWYGNYELRLRKRLAKFTEKHGLLATGGSDYHGTYKPGLELGKGRGDLSVSSQIAANLKTLLDK